jgi:hypothetical protein
MVREDHALSVTAGAEPGADPVAGVVPDEVPDEDVEPAVEEVENGGRLVVDSEVLGAPTA